MSDENIKLQPFNFMTLTYLEWMREIESNELFSGKPAWLKILLAGRADILASYIDARANNNMFHSMFTKENIYNFAWYLDFYPPTPTCATGVMLVTLKEGTALPVTIPKEQLIFSTDFVVGDKPVKFTAISDVTFNSLSQSVSVREGEMFTDTLAYITKGEAFEEFVIERNDFVKGLASISILGEFWEETERFFDSTADDRHFRVVYHYDGYVKIRSGDGTYGKLFPVGESPEVTGWYGGGTRGNQGAGKVTVYSGSSSYVQSATNPAKMSGGAGEMSIDRIKTLAPLFVQAQDRIVSKDDFKVFSLSYPAISRVFVQPNYYGVLSTRVQVVPSGGGGVTSSLRQSLEAYLKNKTLLSGIYVIVTTADYLPQDVAVELRLEDGVSFGEVSDMADLAIKISISEVLAELKEILASEGRTALVEYINTLWGYTFDPLEEGVLRTISSMVRDSNVIEWGEKLYPNKFYTALNLIDGISGVNVLSPAGIIATESNELISVGSVVITEEDKPERTLEDIAALEDTVVASLAFESMTRTTSVGIETYTDAEIV